MTLQTDDGDEIRTFDDDLDGRDVVELLADEYVARRRRGESPTIDEYVERCPDREDDIRSIFPAIAALEKAKPRPSTRNQAPALLCERLGDCRLIREIGRGGMGIVYEAEQESLGRRVAVKVLPHAPWADDRPMKRFLREAQTAASLRHGNIVPVFGVGEDRGLHYYIMPLIPGVGLDRVLGALRETRDGTPSTFRSRDAASNLARTLIDGSFAAPEPRSSVGPVSQSIKDEPGFDAAFFGGKQPIGSDYWRGVARIGVQVADALQHAHDHGVLHRDIKPANLLLDPSGAVWVTDFGLAKALGHADLSRTGDFVGTLRYMAPERLRGEGDALSDVYSLGLTLYELLVLRPAHDAPDGAELIRLIAEEEPTAPRAINPSVPIDLETIVLKAIAADPRRRYPSAGALSADLARFVDGLPILGRRVSKRERVSRWIGRNRVLAALSGTSAVLGIIASFFFYLYLMAPPPQPRTTWDGPIDVQAMLPEPEPEPQPDDRPPPRPPWDGPMDGPDRPPPPRWDGFDGPPPPHPPPFRKGAR